MRPALKGSAAGTCPACPHAKHTGQDCACAPCTCTAADSRKASRGKCKGFTMLPWDALTELAEVYEYGAQKYAPDSWREVPNAIEEYTNAAFRHWAAAASGKVWDEDAARHGFKIRHLAQFLWNVVAVVALTQDRDRVAEPGQPQ